MQLFHSPASPFVRKVIVTLHETDQVGDVELIPVQTSPMASAPEILAHNPTGKLPTLVRTDGPALYDSRVICRYLDARAGAGLYRETRLWATLTLEATGDAIMDAAVAMVYEHRTRPPELVHQPYIDAQWGKVSRTLTTLNSRWVSQLNGPLDMGQIAVACSLGYLDLRLGDRVWRTSHDALAAWYERFCERPSMKASVPQ